MGLGLGLGLGLREGECDSEGRRSTTTEKKIRNGFK